MNNFSSFLDTSNNSMPPRQAPSPNPSNNSSHQSNGIGGGANNGIPMVNGLPSGGQQTDMNHLWSVVQQLSEVLAENRAQTAGIVNGVQQIQARASMASEYGDGLSLREVNGEINNASRTAEIHNIQARLQSAQSTISDLNSSNNSLQNLITDYENALTLLLDKLRPYAYTQTQAMLSLHKHYQGLLEQERNTSMQLRMEHADWQAGLGRVADYARLALKVQSEGELGHKREIKALKEENRVLRRLVGWEEEGDVSDEEEDERVGDRLIQ